MQSDWEADEMTDRRADWDVDEVLNRMVGGRFHVAQKRWQAWHSRCKTSFDCKLSPVKNLLRIQRDLTDRIVHPPCALTIGNFDGVHRGHQAMLSRVFAAANELNLTAAVMTFAPHPREYFAHLSRRPEMAPTQISGLRDKVEALCNQGMASITIVRFNETMASMPAEDFVKDLLARSLNTRWLLVGKDFRFGYRRMGDIEMLRQLGREHGIEVNTLDDVTDECGQRISSSEVRAALALGDMPRAAHLLGRRYAMSGHVVHGRKLGRTLSYPTLNMRVMPRCAARSGVYIVKVFGLSDQPLPGIASLGVRPTVENDGRILLETHVLDAQVDAYGKLVRVELLQHVRDEAKFPDLPTLTAAMHDDAKQARDYFAIHGL